MSDEEATFQPGPEQVRVPFRPRSAYAEYKAYGGGDGAVLVEPGVSRKLRSAAELATREQRVTGGLLFGRGWADDQGAYMVINGFLEAGPRENGEARPDGAGDFTLSEADLRHLRQDAARMHSASLELGWWRTIAARGKFGPRDLMTQAELVGPGGVGLLVYGSGVYWGTAYLGSDAHAPDTAGTLVAVSEPPPDPEQVLIPAAAPDPGPELPELVDISAGEHIREKPQPGGDPLDPPDVLTAAAVPLEEDGLAPGALPPGAWVPRRNRPRMPARVRVPPPRSRIWAARPPKAGRPQPETPTDIKLVAGGLSIAIVAAAIIVGVLLHSAIVAVIIAVIGLVAVITSTWMSSR